MNPEPILTIQNIKQTIKTMSGGERQGIALARAPAFGSKMVILGKVLKLIQRVRDRGVPIILNSHNMSHVFEVADQIHGHRLGRGLCVLKPDEVCMSDTVALMTGALLPDGLTWAA